MSVGRLYIYISLKLWLSIPMCICRSLPSWSNLNFDAISKMYSVLVRFKLSRFVCKEPLSYILQIFICNCSYFIYNRFLQLFLLQHKALTSETTLLGNVGAAHMLHGGSRSDDPTAWDSNKNRDGVALSIVAVGRCVA